MDSIKNKLDSSRIIVIVSVVYVIIITAISMYLYMTYCNDKKYETKLEDALSAKKDDAPPTRFIYDVPPSVEILFIVGLSEEISMNGSRIDISAVRENLEKIIAENPHHRHFGVICPGPEGTDFAIVDRLEDIAREAGASVGFAAC